MWQLCEGRNYWDVDLCLVLEPKSQKSAFDKRLEHSEYENVDVSVFQELPLYVRQRVLKEGIVKFCRDEDAL